MVLNKDLYILTYQKDINLLLRIITLYLNFIIFSATVSSYLFRESKSGFSIHKRRCHNNYFFLINFKDSEFK